MMQVSSRHSGKGSSQASWVRVFLLPRLVRTYVHKVGLVGGQAETSAQGWPQGSMSSQKGLRLPRQVPGSHSPFLKDTELFRKSGFLSLCFNRGIRRITVFATL